MFQVQYRCVFREWWYDDVEVYDWPLAVNRAMQVAAARRTPTRIVSGGRIVWGVNAP